MVPAGTEVRPPGAGVQGRPLRTWRTVTCLPDRRRRQYGGVALGAHGGGFF